MQRRKLLKQIGASSAVAIGATGLASARSDDGVSELETEYVRTELNGEMREFTVEEFEQHPETKSLADVESCTYECQECCDACCSDELCRYQRSCGSCSSC